MKGAKFYLNKSLFKIPEYIISFYCKYRYLLLIFVFGVLLMLVGGNNSEKNGSNKNSNNMVAEFNVNDVENMMESLFKKIEGVGNVEVRLTVKNGFENIYAYNIDQSVSSSASGSNSKLDKQLILISDDGKEKPIILKIKQPEYWGAVIVCEGGNSSTVKYKITQAVKSLTGISADNITVLKMK